jgi:ferredoxin-NADP reductase
MSKQLKIKIKPLGFLDLLAFKNLVPNRKKNINNAAADLIEATPPVNVLAKRLHPKAQHFVIEDVTFETQSAKTFRLVPDVESKTSEPAFFRPGQYLTFSFKINGSTVKRPYSISSSPNEALKGYYDITVKRDEGGFVSSYIFDNWKKGTKVSSSGPEGHFSYDNLRDSKKIIGIAGGCGITPFRSLAKSIMEGLLDIDLILFYGCNKKEDIIFYDGFKELEKNSNGRFKTVFVLAEENLEGFEQGFITSDLIRRYTDVEKKSFFICGPQGLYNFIDKELAKLNIERKYIRREVFGEIKNIDKYDGFPQEASEKSFEVKVHIGDDSATIPARATESLLVALERAGLCPPSGCRSGACGLCRSLLIDGNVYIPKDVDGRRQADIQFGYIHPCSTFPTGNLEMIVPREA